MATDDEHLQQQPLTAEAVYEQFEYERKYLRSHILQKRSAMNEILFDEAEMLEIRNIIDDDFDRLAIDDILVMPLPLIVKVEEGMHDIEPMRRHAEARNVEVENAHAPIPVQPQNVGQSNACQGALPPNNQETDKVKLNDSVTGDILFEENVSCLIIFHNIRQMQIDRCVFIL